MTSTETIETDDNDDLVPLEQLYAANDRISSGLLDDAYERTKARMREPPNAIICERELMGDVLTYGADVIRIAEEAGLVAAHIGTPLLRTVYEAAQAVTARGEHISTSTMMDALLRAGETLEHAGGDTYLHTLLAHATPVQWSAMLAMRVTTSTKLIIEKAQLRAAIEVARRLAASAQMGERPAGELIGEASAALTKIEVTGTEAVADMREVMKRARARLPALGGTRVVEPTGLRVVDDHLAGGVEPGDLIVIAARPSMGKALEIETPVLTPTGWCSIGALDIGDLVIGKNGKPTAVIGVFDQGEVDLFRVSFVDGTFVDTCGEHQWWTTTRGDHKAGRVGAVRCTKDIVVDARHYLPTVDDVEFEPGGDLPIHPYLLGCWLGDGSVNGSSVEISKPDIDLLNRCAELLPEGDTFTLELKTSCPRLRATRRGETCGSELARRLKALGLFGLGSTHRFVPDAYLYSSASDRLAMLQGLLDTDGFVSSTGTCIEFSSTSHRLVDAVAFLTRSLGGIATVAPWRVTTFTNKDGQKQDGAPSRRVIVRLPAQHQPITTKKHTAKFRGPAGKVHRKKIRSIEPIGRGLARCIAVDADDHLFVVKDFIVTHNSQLVLDIAEDIAVVRRRPVFFYSLEMSAEQLVTRMAGARANINTRRKTLTPREQADLLTAMHEIETSPLVIDDRPGPTIDQIVSRSKSRARRQPPAAIIVDYLQYIGEGKRTGGGNVNRDQIISEQTRGLKVLARELECPVYVLAQLNREVEKRVNKRPVMSDIRESGSVEQDADIIAFLYREEYYERERCADDKRGIAELIIAKYRNGPAGVSLALSFTGETPRFSSPSEDHPHRGGGHYRSNQENE